MRASSFFRNVLAMAGGTAIAQSIPIITAPLLARLYTPENFGVFATVLALSGILSAFSTGRYELAIVLPAEERDAQSLLGFVLGLVTAICVATALISVMLWPWIADYESVKRIGGWLYAVPLLAFLLACGQIANSYANRHKKYNQMAAAAVSQQIASVTVTLAIGALKSSALGLITGRMVGVFLHVAMFWSIIRTALAGAIQHISIAGLKRVLWNYRQFPQFNMPYSVLGGFSRDLLIFAFSFYEMIAAAGLFSLTRMVLTAPVYFMSSSISQVFYREAAEHADTKEFRQLTYRLLVASAVVFAPMFALLAYWAPDIFAVVFGERWREAGSFAAPLCVPAALFVLTCWPGRIFEVRRKQHLLLVIQSTFDLVTVSIVFLLLANGATAQTVVAGYAVAQTMFQLVYLAGIAKLFSLGWLRYTKIVILAATIWLGLLLVGNLLAMTNLSALTQCLLQGTIAVLAAATGLLTNLWLWDLLAPLGFKAPGKRS